MPLAEFEVIPIEYKVEVFDGGVAPYLVLKTFGGWNIEGDFIITYDVNGLRTAYRIDKEVMHIVTVEVAGKDNGFQNSQEIALPGDTLEPKEETVEVDDVA
jgi:hypothetical protein